MVCLAFGDWAAEPMPTGTCRTRDNYADSRAGHIASVYACRSSLIGHLLWLDRAYRQRDGWLPSHKSGPVRQEPRARPPLQGVAAEVEAAGVAICQALKAHYVPSIFGYQEAVSEAAQQRLVSVGLGVRLPTLLCHRAQI